MQKISWNSATFEKMGWSNYERQILKLLFKKHLKILFFDTLLSCHLIKQHRFHFYEIQESSLQQRESILYCQLKQIQFTPILVLLTLHQYLDRLIGVTDNIFLFIVCIYSCSISSTRGLKWSKSFSFYFLECLWSWTFIRWQIFFMVWKK